MGLDIRTMSIVIAVSAGITSLGLFAVPKDQIAKPHANRIWAWGNLIRAIAFIFLASRGQIPDFISIILSNLLIYFVEVFHYRSLTIFFETKDRIQWLYLIGGIVFLAFLYFAEINPNINARVTIITVAELITFSVNGWMFWHNRHHYQKNIALFNAGSYFIMVPVFVLRATLTFSAAYKLHNVFTQNLIQDLIFQSYFINTLAATFGFVIMNNSYLTLRLSKLAHYDSLTQVLNRHSIIEHIHLAFEEYQKTGTPLTLMMIDMDNFKTVNDQYGHATGDRVLRAIAQAIKHNLRGPDVVGRYGGDEFLILMPDTNAEQADQTKQRLQKDPLEITIAPEDPPTKLYFSVGTATLTPNIESIEKLIDQADKSLYAEKVLKKKQSSSTP